MKSIHISGKRKRAIARATLKAGKGKVRINKIPLEYYDPLLERMKIMEPLNLAGEVANTIDIDVTVIGGGINGQAEAVRLAIGRALSKYDKKLEKVLLNYDRQLLVADVRRKESAKPNRHGQARAKVQKSYR